MGHMGPSTLVLSFGIFVVWKCLNGLLANPVVLASVLTETEPLGLAPGAGSKHIKVY